MELLEIRRVAQAQKRSKLTKQQQHIETYQPRGPGPKCGSTLVPSPL